MLPLFLSAAGRTAVEGGVELRHPFVDLRLVEFALNIPEEQRRRGPFIKFVLRQAMGEDLPDVVRLRTTKGDFAHLVVEAIEAVGGERLFETLRVAESGWVDPAAALRTYQALRRSLPQGHAVYGAYVPELWAIASLETWYREAFGGNGRGMISAGGADVRQP